MIRGKIWYEIADIKMGEHYLSLYMNRCRSNKKFFRILTILFSTTGVFGWKFWEYYAQFVCFVIAAIQLLTTFSDHLVKSDEDINKLAELRSYYTRYCNQLEDLWTRLESELCTEKEANDTFSELKSTLGQKIQDLDNALHLNGKILSFRTESQKETNQYLINRYGTTENNNTISA